MTLDKRSQLRKFFDQTMFGQTYTVTLDPEDAEETLHQLRASTRHDWRIKGLIHKLEAALRNPYQSRKSRVAVLRSLGTSDVLLLKEALSSLTTDSLLPEEQSLM